MELFIPSILVLLLAAFVVFFFLPRFAPLVLAVVSLVLLFGGVYQHYNQFSSEYRLSTWQFGLVNYAPYILLGGLLFSIISYFVYIFPSRAANTTTSNFLPVLPTIGEMPPAETSTNVVTGAINKTLNTVTNVANSVAKTVGLKNNTSGSNNQGFFSATPKRNNKGLGYPFSQV